MNGRGSVSAACCARAKFYSNGQCQLFRGGSSHLGMSVFCFSVKCLEGNTGDSLKYPVNCSGCVAFKFQEMLWNESEKKFIIFYFCHTKTLRGVGCLAEHLDLRSCWNEHQEIALRGVSFGSGVSVKCGTWIFVWCNLWPVLFVI